MGLAATVMIVGCGYTGSRVAQLLLGRRSVVHVTGTAPASLAGLVAAGAVAHPLDVRDRAQLDAFAAAVRALPGSLAVLHSVPVIEEGGEKVDPTPRLIAALGDRPERVVYLSTTGVYGATTEVDERTLPAPRAAGEHLRLAAERAVAAGPWSTLVLRSAAIYGPGRGVHVAVRTGRYRAVGAGAHVVSRIHVDDLVALVVAALSCEVDGAYPVADDRPAVSADIARYAARLLGLPEANPDAAAEEAGTMHAGRRVDGRAVRRILGVTLRYPSYLTGIPAVIAAERAAAVGDLTVGDPSAGDLTAGG